MPDGATGKTTRKHVLQHKLHKTQFDIIKSCYDTLKQQILSDFHKEYVEIVANGNVGFSNTTTIKLLNILYNAYGTITPRKT